MTMARFARGETMTHAGTGRTAPAYYVFIWEVNEALADTFSNPETEEDVPGPGYTTERYPTARVIHGPGDEGIRVIADTDEAAAAFRTAATRLGIHIT